MNQVWGWLGETKNKEVWIRGGFPGGTVVKKPPANAGDAGSIPGSGRSPGEGNGNHSSILAWEIPWTEESGGLQSMVLRKSQTQLSD